MTLKHKKTLIRMAKFSFSSVIAEVIECGIFFLVMYFFNAVLGGAAELVASIVGRIIANIINFTLNKKLVFKVHGGMRKQLIRFFTFSAVQLLCSVALIMLINNMFGIEEALPASLVKYGVDLVLFFVGYGVQKRWVFRKSAENENPSEEAEQEKTE